MITKYPQLSDWTITQSGTCQHPLSRNETCGNDVDSFNTDSMHDKQDKSNNYENKR
jgi:hypothetical protein